MKCDELKPLLFSISDLAYVDEIRVTKNFQNPHDHAVYKATEVEAAIAELKAENERLKRCEIWMKQHFYCEEVIACESAKNRRLKRALWLARAELCKMEKERWANHIDLGGRRNRKDPAYVKTGKLLTATEWSELWDNNERKCRAKAEEYK